MTRVYKLAAAVIGTTNAAAQIQFQRAGSIIAIVSTIAMEPATTGDKLRAELSFASTGQWTVNDTVGPIYQHDMIYDLVTSGSTLGGQSLSVAGLNIGVNSGDRLYLNISLSAAPTSSSTVFFVYVEERM